MRWQIRFMPSATWTKLEGIEEGTLEEVTQAIEEGMFLEAFQNTGGNRTRAARALGLTRQGLYNKIAQCNIRIWESEHGGTGNHSVRGSRGLEEMIAGKLFQRGVTVLQKASLQGLS